MRKTFRLPRDRYSTVKHRVLHPLRTQPSEQLVALRGVSLDVAAGEFLGIAGRNGSGKSTLLRCLCGIYPIDAGALDVRGRVAPYIELGVGFNPQMTARDNVVINAVMLGMTPREARARFDEIIAFAELEEFIDLKLMNYSSGMIVRLAFAVTIQVDADVLLFDEVLAVGDAAFQQKCYERFQEMKDAGKTILLVTHDMSLVERFCDRAVLLEAGELAEVGEPALIARRYGELSAARGAKASAATPGRPEPRRPRQRAEIRDAWFENADARQVDVAPQGESCCACVEVAVNDALVDPVFELSVRDGSHRIVFATSSRWAHGPTGPFGLGETAIVRVRFDNCLAPGRYTISALVRRDGGALLDERATLATLSVYGTRVTGGMADLPHDFEVSRT